MSMFVSSRTAWRSIAVACVGALVLAALPLFLSPYGVRVGQLFVLAAGLAVAWTILGGFSGYWSFGNAAFVGTGAFVAALTPPFLPGWPPAAVFTAGLVAAMTVNGVLALLIAWPILRLRGIYFAIAMLGVSQVCFELINNIDGLRGALGVNLVDVVPAGARPERFYYWAFLIASTLAVIVAICVRHSRIGYGLIAIREDEDTARMLGVPTVRFKIIAFVISAMLTALLGVVYAHNLGYITANSVFRGDFNLNVIVYSLLGGMGTILGPIIGAGVMTFVTQILLGDLLDVHMFITGLIIAVLVLAAPNGLLGAFDAWRLRRRRRQRGEQS